MAGAPVDIEMRGADAGSAEMMIAQSAFWVGLLYVIGGIASWLFYQADKRAAEKDRDWGREKGRILKGGR